jgi:hypothetical protein
MSSALIAVGTFDMLDFRGGRSSLRDEISVALGAVETLLGPLEWPPHVPMETVLYAVPPECRGSLLTLS